MPSIEILDAHVADLIAAGEVVERPASAVKELMENSIDAGAKNITVEIRAGGASQIRVTDDGCGMGIEDAATAFLRHATSKLKAARDLEAIGTLGFRGEALAAIAAVSRVKLLTRRESDAEGVSVRLEAGVLHDVSPTGAPVGTTISVSDLFFNTPARQKFLKSDRAESAACYQTALRVALGRPDISVRFIRDGGEELFTPGDGLTLSCIYSLFGRDFAAKLSEAAASDEAVSVHGFVSRPELARGNRAAQYFFVNGRAIRSGRLQAALEQAYASRLMTGRYPSCVLNITVNPAAVDVNVHPSKLEVKFSDERRVFDAVYYAALGALNPPGAAAVPEKASPPPEPPQAEAEPALTRTSISSRPQTALPVLRDSLFTGYRPSAAEPEAPVPESPAQAPSPPPPSAAPERTAPDFRLAGEAMGTYIIADTGRALVLIDKHAAHERIIFDRLRSEKRESMPQMLITPVTLDFGGGHLQTLLDSFELLESLGFELELFGERSVILRAVPADTCAEDARALLEEIIEKLSSGRKAEDAAESIMRSVACKAAIKAGKSSEYEENYRLAELVLSGKAEHCPHGRPVSLTLTKKEIDKLFGRLG